MANSINTNIAAYYAQTNITNASNAAAGEVARLSSGNRIVQASDDVAALAIGTSLQSTVSALKTAQSNASQGISLLQVADGALAQIQTILQQQQSIALQAASGSLTNTDRSFLNQEFQALTAQIDSLSKGTTFNGVSLLDGSLSTSAAVATTTAAATAGSLSTTFSTPIVVGDTININGSVLTAVAQNSTATGLQFNLGSSLADSVSNLAARLNTLKDTSAYATTIGAATYSASNGTLTATARSGGSLSNAFTLGGTTTSYAITSGAHLATSGGAASNLVTVQTTAANNYAVGQYVIVNLAANASLDGITNQNLRGVITSVTNSTTFVFAAQTNATSGNVNSASASTVTLAQANAYGAASTNGGSINSSFNLFASSSAWTSATTAISGSSPSAAVPFKDGDTLTATVNGNVSNLATLGTGTTLQGLVNDINADTGTSGFSAALVYNGSTYNVNVRYAGNAGNVLINGGTNYYTGGAATNPLTGLNLSATANNIGEATFSNKSLISTGYIDVTGAAASQGITVATQATVVTAAVGSTAAATPFAVGDTLSLSVNGTTQNLHTFTAIDTLNSIVTDVNSHTASTGVYAEVFGSAAGHYNLRLFTTVQDPAHDQVIANAGANIGGVASSTVTTLTTTSGGLSQTAVASGQNGIDNGVNQGSTTATGTVGDSVLAALSQTAANASVLFTANPVANNTITVDGQAFYFTSNTTAAPNEILIGSTTQATIQNAVSTINNYLSSGAATGDVAYVLNQLNVTGTANTLNFTAKGLGDVNTLAGTGAVIAQSVTGGALVGGTLTNGSASIANSGTFGVNTQGIDNSAFQGTLQGFTATYDNSASTVDLSIKVGNNTYTAKSVNAAVTSNTTIRLYSDTVSGVNGGYFDLQLKANQIQPFTTQAGATAFAQHLNSAFSSLTFLQTQQLSSYNGSGSISADGSVIGSLNGTSVSAQLKDFSGQNISAITVTAPTGSSTDAQIALTINGVNYTTASGIGSTLGANQTYKLTSAVDPNQFINFTTGNSAITISSADDATAVQNALKTAFGAVAGSSSLQFQIGASSTDTLAVSIGSAQSSSLFAGATLDVSTQAGAAAASTAVNAALNTATSLRATVGALESRFNFASAALQTSVQNQDAARGQLLDTDIAATSTKYATDQVKLQAGISVLAQANQQLQALLKLIG